MPWHPIPSTPAGSNVYRPKFSTIRNDPTASRHAAAGSNILNQHNSNQTDSNKNKHHHPPKMPSESKSALQEFLTAPPSRAALLRFISYLDQECIASEDVASLPNQILARAVVALGYTLIDAQGAMETIIETIKAAENYALHPTEQNWDLLFHCATRSYPFGPGDGCLSIPELENGVTCQPGSGCISGAGSLASLGLDDAAVFATIAAELLPWINGTDDPLISRAQHV